MLTKLIAALNTRGIGYWDSVSLFRKAYLTTALEANGWNCLATSQALGIHRNTLNRAMSELGIKREARKNRKAA